MDEDFYKFALWLHLLGLVAGLGGGISNSQIGPAIGTATAETRPTLWKLHHAMSRIATTGLIVMLVTGPLLVWMRYSNLSALTPWFWVKMGFVLMLLVSIAITVRAAKQVEAGDVAATKTMMVAGRVSGLVSTATVLIAVIAFG